MSRHFTRDLFLGTTLIALIGLVAVALTPIVQETARMNIVAEFMNQDNSAVLVTQDEINEAIRLTTHRE